MKQILIKFFSFLSCFILLLQVGNAQEEWTLKQCLDYVEQHNIQLRQGQLSAEKANMQVEQTKYSLGPNLNGNVDLGLNIGRNVDPTTYQFVNQTTFTNQYGLSVNQTIFAGLAKLKTIEKGKLDYKAIKLDNEALLTNIQLNVLTAYLNILNAEEQIVKTKNTQKSTLAQYERTKTLIKAGALAERAIVDIEAQMANEESTLVALQNQLEFAYNSLNNLLQLGNDKNIRVIKPNFPEIDMNKEIPSTYNVYVKALMTRPEIKSQNIRIESAKKSIEIAKADKMPTISFFANSNTGFSNQARQFLFNPVDPQNPIVSKVKYGKQLNDNFGFNTGIRLTVPIFNGRAPYFSNKSAQFGVANAELNLKNAELQFYQTIQQANQRAETALKTYEIALKTLKSAENSLAYAKDRLDRGVLTQLEYNLAKNNRDVVESQVTQAKYEYIFSTKVLDFYMGNDLTLE